MQSEASAAGQQPDAASWSGQPKAMATSTPFPAGYSYESKSQANHSSAAILASSQESSAFTAQPMSQAVTPPPPCDMPITPEVRPHLH